MSWMNLCAASPFPHQFRTDESKVYYYEDFRNYGAKIPGMIEERIVLGNDPIHKHRSEVNVELKKNGLIFKNQVPEPGAIPDLKDYDVLFQFRLRPNEEKQLGGFELRMHTGSDAKGGEVVVAISPRAIKLSSNGIAPAIQGDAELPFEIAQNQWHDCAIRVRGGVMTVFMDDNRVMKEVAQAPLPGTGIKGINFYADRGAAFSVSELLIRDPAPLPDHTITNLLPAPRKVDPAKFTAGGSKTVPANDSFGATLRTGPGKEGASLSLIWADGRENRLTFQTIGTVEKRKKKVDDKGVTEDIGRPDAIIRVTGIADRKKPLDYYVRPMLRRYHGGSSFTDTYYDLTRDWELLPKASEHPLKVEAKRTAAGVDLYLDGRYAGRMAGGEIKAMTFNLSPEASLGPIFSDSLPASASETKGFSRYLPLDVAALGMAKAFSNATSSLKPGLSEIKGIPLAVASGDGSADVGLVREGQGTWGLEVDEYLSRSAFDGLLTEVHFSIPGRMLYNKAWVLCAADPDTNKDPILTTRLVAYERKGGAAANLLADTKVTLPRAGEKPGEGITPVGTVIKPLENGKSVEVPLYLVEVPLGVGKILDESMQWPTLDLDFLGKTLENYQQIDKTVKPDPRSTSAVQIFGVTLEKSPVTLAFEQSQPGNVFHNDEKPETTAILRAFAPAKGKLVWEIFDTDGRKTGGGSKNYQFAKADEEQRVVVPLSAPDVGWYQLSMMLQDEAGKTILRHPASFAQLGKDERKAKYDSPYGTWVWHGAHGTVKDVGFEGPLLFKAGIRMANCARATEKEWAPWSITKPQLNFPFKFDQLAKPEGILEAAEAAIRKGLEDYPHLREVLIFHESGPGSGLPRELFGLKPDLSDKEQAREAGYAQILNLAGGLVREKFPQLKTVVGNSGASQATIAAALRHGGKAEYIDTIGIETPAQVFIPEKLQEGTLQGYQFTKEIARILSGRDIPASGCYEFTYRNERDLGQLQQAQWYMRDILISHAYRYTLISPSSLMDVSAPYYSTYWGSCGLLERGPYAYPKRAYVAYATLTNVLDQVTLRRQIPTGSTTVYALEFDRADKKKAAALWASRGDAEYILEFDGEGGETSVKIIEMDGKTREEKTKGGKLVVKAGASPVYTLTDKEIKAITLGKRTFPKDAARAKLATVAASLDRAEAVAIDPDNSLDVPLETSKINLPVWKAGTFDLHQAQDSEKGDCVELELKTDQNRDLSKYITEYTTLRLKEPVTVKGNPAALGVWVKGNSNWGRVMFEIEDAQGEVWRSIGTGGWGCDILDWPGNIAVNFDGWNFLALPLRDTTLFNDHSPGPVLEQWVSGGGNKKMEFPIKIRALIVEMNRKAIDLTEIKEISNPAIRIKDVSGVYER